jgi:hypothetical protein
MREEIVVLFAYHFPPQNVIGAVRPYRLVKYLRRLGVRCYVITAANDSERPDIEDVAFISDPFITRPREGFGWQVERALRRFLLPGEVGTQWSVAAYKRAKAFIGVHENARITLLSTYPPFGSHFAGYWLARNTQLPWIADFRDPLTSNLSDLRFNSPQKAVYRRLERLFVGKAKCVIANTDAAQLNFQVRYPERAQDIELLWNGFDPEERLQALPIPQRKQKVFSHVGELYGRRDITPLLKSIRRLFDNKRLSPHEIHIQLVGPTLPTTIPDEPFLSAAIHEGWLTVVPEQIPRSEAQAISCTSDGLLLIQPQSVLQVPAKLYEYVQIGRPILAFVPRDSPVERILEQSGVAYGCAYATDPPDVFDESVLNFFKLDTTVRRPSTWFEATFNAQCHAQQLYKLICRLHGDERTRKSN